MGRQTVVNRCFLNTRQASFHLGVSASYLARLRQSDMGPPFRQHSRCILYHIDDLNAWSLATRRSGPSSEVRSHD